MKPRDLIAAQAPELLGDVLGVDRVEAAGTDEGRLLASPGIEVALGGGPVLGGTGRVAPLRENRIRHARHSLSSARR
ncbi:hypothetical protein [Methylobacterium sp. ID0610]|uniref:hypothetical protein n=1 Tax=Methylobacterium carpenticola TaxID=3344827 RepID=UPI0036828D47